MNSKHIKTKSFRLAVIIIGDTNSKKLAILIPGRLDTKDYANFISHAEYLAGHGFLALAFDPPGTWESDGTIEDYTTTNYIKAVNEIIEYFGNRPTLLLGHSRGGTTAMLSCMQNPAINGIVLIMANYGTPTPPRKQTEGFIVSHRDLPPGTSITKEQKHFRLPISYWKDGQKYNPIQALEKCTKPKILIYGTEDEFVSPEEVKSIFQKIPEPKMMSEVKSEHDYRRNKNAIQEVNKAIGKFLNQYHF